MFDIKKREVQFEYLEFEDKKQRILDLLSVLKEQGNVFDKIYIYIINWWNINDNNLVEIHNKLLEAMYEIDVFIMEKSLDELEAYADNISNIKNKELLEKEDTELLLNNL